MGKGVSSPSFPFYKKEKYMDKLSKILMMVWMVLAIASFVCSFLAPLLIKIVGIVFGSLNLMIIGSWVISLIQGIAQARRLKEEEEK